MFQWNSNKWSAALLSLCTIGRVIHGNIPDRNGLQSIIKNEGYYYGFGLTQKLRVSISKSNITAFANISQTKTSSINSNDRFQNQVTTPLDYSDTKRSSEVGVSFDLAKNLRFTIKNEQVYRSSHISDGYNSNKEINRKWIQIHYVW